VSFRPPPLPAFLAAGLVLLGAGYLWGRKAAPPSPAPVDRSAQAARLAFWDGLSRRVDSEAVDPAWSRETEAVIERVIPAQLGPPVSVEAACASTICRATLSHPGWPRIPEDEFVRFTLNRESLGTMEIQLDTRAEGTTTLYFLRRGP
jgi:hypothetical protein